MNIVRRAVVLTALALAAVAGAQQPSGTPIRIGSTLALTGPLASTGLVHQLVGDIYVADRGNHRVCMFDKTGRYVEKFIGDATISKSGRAYILANPKVLRGREMTTLESQRRLRGPMSVRVVGDLLEALPGEGLRLRPGLIDRHRVVRPVRRQRRIAGLLEEVRPGGPAARQQPETVDEDDRGVARGVGRLDLPVLPVGHRGHGGLPLRSVEVRPTLAESGRRPGL